MALESVQNTSGRKSPPGRGVRIYLADDSQAEQVYFTLKQAGLTDAAKRVGRAAGRQRARLAKRDAA